MADRLPDNAPDIPPANDDVPLHTDEEPPREPSPPAQNVRLPSYDRDNSVIFVEGSNNLLSTNGPRMLPVFGVPFAFMYQNDNQEMVDFQGHPLNEPDLIVGLNTSHPEDALVFLEAVNESNTEFRQSDCAQSRPQSSGSSSRPQSSGSSSCTQACGSSSRPQSSGSSSCTQSSGSSSRPLLSRSSTQSTGSSSRPQSSGSSSRPQSSGTSSRPQSSGTSSRPQSSGSSSQDDKFGIYDDASKKDDQPEKGDDSKQN